jgi:hypothetical protein
MAAELLPEDLWAEIEPLLPPAPAACLLVCSRLKSSRFVL